MQIESDEYFFNPGWFREKTNSIFTILQQPRQDTSSLFSTKNLLGGFQVSLHPDVEIHKRSIYNALDFLGDVGGLQEALLRLGSIFLFFFGSNG